MQTEEQKKLIDQYCKGEITGEEFTKAIDRSTKVSNDCNILLPAVFIDEAAQIIQTLMEYGSLKTVQGVIYGGASHSNYLEKAREWLYKYRSARNGS